ncbi:MAG: hypothetical protein PVF58_14350 [Candidatus Methanofastidiosia archaeon]|jgi:hypothetical protein
MSKVKKDETKKAIPPEVLERKNPNFEQLVKAHLTPTQIYRLERDFFYWFECAINENAISKTEQQHITCEGVKLGPRCDFFWKINYTLDEDEIFMAPGYWSYEGRWVRVFYKPNPSYREIAYKFKQPPVNCKAWENGADSQKEFNKWIYIYEEAKWRGWL